MVRILVVGQGPSKDGVGKKPLDGDGSGERLAELCGLSREEMLANCTAVNLLNKFYGKNGKGDKFPMDDAKKSAEALRVAWDNYDRVVLLGQNVAKAFGVGEKLLSWESDRGGSVVAVVPHPSPINLWYNDEKNYSEASKFLSALFRGERQQIVMKNGDKKNRAEYCTRYLETFDKQIDLVELAKIIEEVKRDELYLEVGSKTADEWIRVHAPRSYRMCYMAQSCYRVLKEHFSDAEIKLMPPETARWAASSKNISPAELSKPEVKEALMLPKQKAVEVLRAALPDQHIENTEKVTCKFAVSQHRIVQDGYEVFKKHKDEAASFEDFVEFCVSEWILSFAGALK